MAIDDSKCKMPEDPDKGGDAQPANLHESQFDLDDHAAQKEKPNTPAIDSKPMIRVRNPPGGKSSIMF